MAVSALDIQEKIDRRDLLPFVIFCIASVLFLAAGYLLKLPVAGALPAAALVLAMVMKSAKALLVVLFATFSIAVSVSVFSLDVFVILLLFGYWLAVRYGYRIKEENAKWQRRLAWVNLLWIGGVFAWHYNDYGVSGFVVSIGTKLILYFLLFIIVLDIASGLTKEEIVSILHWAWVFSLIVTGIAVFQHYYLGMSRIHSILEDNHADLGNYSIGAAMLCAVISVLHERRAGKLFALLTVFMSVVSLVVSETRADIIGIGVGLALFGLMRGFRGILIVTVIAGLLLGTGIVSKVLHKEESLTLQAQDAQIKTSNTGIKASYDPSSVDRILMWYGLFTMEQHSSLVSQLCGFGPGNIPNASLPHMQLHYLYTGVETALAAHNNYFNVFVELGAIGFLLFFGFIGSLLWFFYRTWRAKDTKTKILAAITISGTIALLVSGFTQETFYTEPSMGNFMGFYLTMVALLIGLLLKEKNVLMNREQITP